MVNTRIPTVLIATLLTAGWGQAVEPLTLEIQAQSKVQFTVITIGNVARITGGDSALREQIGRLDVADMKPREQSLAITRRVVEYRLQLAGIDLSNVRVIGAERTTITQDKRTITADEVVAAARTEVFHWLSVPLETVAVELARPVAVRLPEVPTGELVTITATPHVKPVGLGRVQMHVVIATLDEKLLSVGVDLDVKAVTRRAEPISQVAATIQPQARQVDNPAARTVVQANAIVPASDAPTLPTMPANHVIPASAAVPANSTAVLVHPRQRVTMVVHSGGLNVTAVGEAQQEGRLGQTILVQNIDSKKIVNARVSGPGAVDIQLEP